MKKSMIISAALLLMWPALASAETTGVLFRQCMDFPRKKNEFYYCLGYMAGVHDIMNIKRDNLQCGPTELPNVSNNELVEQFLDWARQNPERWDEPAYLGMIATIDTFYPCPREGYDYKLEDPGR